MKFGVEVLYIMVSSKLEFCENWLRDSHTLLMHVTVFLLILLTLLE
jgi:hypothetical protein